MSGTLVSVTGSSVSSVAHRIGQHGILVARRGDGAGERLAAVDDEIGHGKKRRPHEADALECARCRARWQELTGVTVAPWVRLRRRPGWPSVRGSPPRSRPGPPRWRLRRLPPWRSPPRLSPSPPPGPRCGDRRGARPGTERSPRKPWGTAAAVAASAPVAPAVALAVAVAVARRPIRAGPGAGASAGLGRRRGTSASRRSPWGPGPPARLSRSGRACGRCVDRAGARRAGRAAGARRGGSRGWRSSRGSRAGAPRGGRGAGAPPAGRGAGAGTSRCGAAPSERGSPPSARAPSLHPPCGRRGTSGRSSRRGCSSGHPRRHCEARATPSSRRANRLGRRQDLDLALLASGSAFRGRLGLGRRRLDGSGSATAAAGAAAWSQLWPALRPARSRALGSRTGSCIRSRA